jgi:hypothetical protein
MLLENNLKTLDITNENNILGFLHTVSHSTGIYFIYIILNIITIVNFYQPNSEKSTCVKQEGNFCFLQSLISHRIGSCDPVIGISIPLISVNLLAKQACLIQAGNLVSCRHF